MGLVWPLNFAENDSFSKNVLHHLLPFLEIYEKFESCHETNTINYIGLKVECANMCKEMRWDGQYGKEKISRWSKMVTI